jgi:hypothetical protein
MIMSSPIFATDAQTWPDRRLGRLAVIICGREGKRCIACYPSFSRLAQSVIRKEGTAGESPGNGMPRMVSSVCVGKLSNKPNVNVNGMLDGPSISLK